ncbi:hypothetical protein [Kitasatospora sp. NPDC001175]|uniref:hypothetical protein n=1 Tax=Kitasatospora sp. NPDC001175 TaxID=3157103 RepID=UPI003D07D981
MERQVRRPLDQEVRELASFGLTAVSCVADGPDTWLAEAVPARGGRLEVVVPAAEP